MGWQLPQQLLSSPCTLICCCCRCCCVPGAACCITCPHLFPVRLHHSTQHAHTFACLAHAAAGCQMPRWRLLLLASGPSSWLHWRLKSRQTVTSRFHSGDGRICCTLAAGDLLAQSWGLLGLGGARVGHNQHALSNQHAQLMCTCAPRSSSLLPRRLSNETHATAQRKQEQMEKLRQAFGLKDVSTTASSVLLGCTPAPSSPPSPTASSRQTPWFRLGPSCPH